MAKGDFGMKHFLYGIVIILLARHPAQTQHMVWKSDDLNRLEMYSLFDLIELASGYTFASSDDATLQLSRDGATGGAFIPVYLDGQPLHIQHWNTMSLHNIPVTLAQIDSLVITHHPQMDNGAFNERGGLYIYSKKPAKEGIAFHVGTEMGNRSGDPGPFVYTEKASRNIERLGPISAANVAYHKQDFSLSIGAKQFVHAVTDPLQYRRIPPFQFGGGPYRHEKIRSHSLYLKADAKTGRFSHQLQMGGSNATDFLFTELYGTEIPIASNWNFFALKGKGAFNPNMSIQYALSHNASKIKEYPNKENKWLRWQQNVTDARIFLRHQLKKGSSEIGLKSAFYNLKNPIGSPHNLESRQLGLYQATSFAFTSRVLFHTNLEALKGNDIAFKSNAGLRFRLHPAHFILAEATYAQRLPEESNSLWYWISQGFGGDSLAGFNPGFQPKKSTHVQGRLAWEGAFSHFLHITFSAVFSRNADELIFDYRLTPKGQKLETGSFNFIHSNASFLSLPMHVALHYSPKLHQTFRYTLTRQLAGNASLFEMHPRHKFLSNISWQPAASFKIWATMVAKSSSKWAAAEELHQVEVWINTLQTEVYDAQQPAMFRFDFGMRKHFWNQRVALSLNLQNMNNVKYRNHPISPRHAFSVFMGMKLEL